ncbi:triacylglycerol lipase [Herbiconiux sp. L3-i23]|uniref:esterase/lipase family protein n=1 Tax=Herbiconiux sp. L3-i23 TaxID=2905871 RepID=UPI002069EE96|nr:alpha/beta hydrolase [Herbiconiux sp. L3-i23]BDI22160.1 hypothetical protein L3i23_09360 [Herbiconiux sp. L3-i23]
MSRLLRLVGLGFEWALDYLYAGVLILRGSDVRITPSRYATGRDSMPPVVLVPGVYENWRFMGRIADRIHAAGHPVHVVTALRRNTAAVPASAELVLAYLRMHDLHGVILVAHSKGGLIGKLAMLRDDENRIDRMFAIATPFSGSTYARYMLSPTLRAFSPSDATLVSLAEQIEVNSRITSIWARFDPHIPGGSELVGATNIELPVAGHFRILGAPAMLEELDRTIAGRPEG